MRIRQLERNRRVTGCRRRVTLGTILIYSAVLVLAALPFGARAAGVVVGPDCTITIIPPTLGGFVSGYRLYYGETPGARTLSVDIGLVTQATCSAQGIPEGQIYMIARAYNIVGEGADSIEFPFVLVTGLPGAPGILVTPRAP